MKKWGPKAFIGGHPVLDFLNTGGGDTKARDVERLETFFDVLTWACAASVIDDQEYSALERIADESPDVAAACLMEMRVQRESLYRLILSLIERKTIAETDRLLVQSHTSLALAHAQLTPHGDQLATWRIGIEAASLSLVEHRLFLAASTLITNPSSRNIRQCETCSWLFMDPSATKRRRWCSMAVCGNRAKALRHYQKSHGSAEGNLSPTA